MASLATDTGVTTGSPLNDCYGKTTQTAGTAITRVLPPKSGARTCGGATRYKAAATAHTMTFLVEIDRLTVASEVASGATTVTLSRAPTSNDGSIWASGDYLIMQYEDGTWNQFLLSGVSGLVGTIPATTQKILKGTTCYFMGAPGDHTLRQFSMEASTLVDLPAGDFRARTATSAFSNSPILQHIDNATNAGTLYFTQMFFD